MSIITDKVPHGLKIAGISLLQAVIKVSEKAKKKARKVISPIIFLMANLGEMISHFVRALRDLILSNYYPDYGTSGVTDPFLQVKFLGLMCELPVGDSKTAHQFW